MNWNVCNPSRRRAIEQVKWIRNFDPDVVVLTEVKLSDGCRYIADKLLALDYRVLYPEPGDEGYGVLIASRVDFVETPFSDCVDAGLKARVASILLNLYDFDFEVTGVYVPIWRDERKRRFLECLIKGLGESKANRIFCGDFNILEPGHVPHYTKFEDWEYSFYESLRSLGLSDAYRLHHPKDVEHSWVGWADNGYRYDHVFASTGLVPFVAECRYLHGPRLSKLSDHSAMQIEFATE